MGFKSLAERDREVIWHPYTQMKTSELPLAITRGKGAYLYTENGTRLIDAVSSWWVNIHGHSHPYIAGKISEQLLTLEHVIFAGFTHPAAVEFAERFLKILPVNQTKAFYSDNGSTAVEVALKMCFQFWSNRNIKKNKILAFNNSYHGDTFGAMAVSARSAFTKAFEPLLFEVIFIDLPTTQNLQIIRSEMERNTDELAGFIFEPLVQGAGGMRMYDAECLDQLLQFANELGILTVADEVMTGFGRTGKMFASQYLSQEPDIMCFSKGITGGTMALGLTTCSQRIYDAFLSDNHQRTLFHGHSFTANPIACTAALASLDLFETENTFTQIARISYMHNEFARSIKDHPKLSNVRQQGTILAMEWNSGSETSYFNTIRDRLYEFFLARGVILRPLGNIIYIMPPFCISDADLEEVYDSIREALLTF